MHWDERPIFMLLRDRDLKAAKPDPAGGVRRLSDGHGLYLQIAPDGAKYWRFQYTVGGSRKTISLGVYPYVSLKDARAKHFEAKRKVEHGVDPSAERQHQRQAGVTFEVIAREWLAQQTRVLSPTSHEVSTSRVTRYLMPALGARPIATLTTQDIWQVIHELEETRGNIDTVHRVALHASQIMRYAVRTGRAPHDVTAELRGALTPVTKRNHPRLKDPRDVGTLLHAVGEMTDISPFVRAAMQVMAYVFVRSHELRGAVWSEIDLDAALWTIPGSRMKRTRAVQAGAAMPDHLVPLSRQVIAILKTLKTPALTSSFVFPSMRSTTRELSDGTLTAVLRRLGYGRDQMQVHGFRGIASTMLRERPLSFPNDVIELQLAHKFKSGVRAAYDSAELLEARTEMMQRWADHLDALKAAVKRPSIHGAA